MKTSKPGVYRGWSEPVANGYVRSSEHVAMPDGCLIAVDVLRPGMKDEPLPGPFPVVLFATGYRRSYLKGEQEFTTAVSAAATANVPVGGIITAYEQRPLARGLVHHGYAIVAMDLRGTGASFGTTNGAIWKDGQDVARVVDWAASQPWCTGRVGMTGGSWEGVLQLATAAAQPGHLSCIVPAVAPTPHNALVVGGFFAAGFLQDWSQMRGAQDTLQRALPVDGPDGQRLLDETLELRRQEQYVWKEGDEPPAPSTGATETTLFKADLLSASGVPTYLTTGWWDMSFVDDLISLYNTLTLPKRIFIGPCNHSTGYSAVESMRWFDRWLKDILNGVDTEPPIVYSTSEASGQSVWRAAMQWPLPEASALTLYAAPGPTKTVASSNDGSLAADAPDESVDTYPVDESVGLGEQSRMRYMFRSVQIVLPNLVKRAERCLTYSGEPLAARLEIAGTPVARLRLRTSAPGGGVFVTLEDVAPDGSSRYLTEGVLNLEYRKVSRPPFARHTDAWHSLLDEDRQDVTPGEWMDVHLELLAVSVFVEAGHRLRLTLAGADADNYRTPTFDQPPVLDVQLGRSRIDIPVVAPDASRTAEVIEDGFADEEITYAFDVD